MLIQEMFEKDINRDINGVIKVAQNDEASLKQELSEYIITNELRKHFRSFFNSYEAAIEHPTDKIGVWISGFFGSGKSHFLKILSYLLTNEEVAGKRAVEYFKDKFDDPMMYASAVNCASIPTESILFNIDIEGPVNKDKTAVLRVFAKTFYNHCGFYGDDLKIAKLERFIDKEGKTDEFREVFEQINGASWEETRPALAFFEDDMVKVLHSVLGMSETAARNWFNGVETNELSISQLVSDIKEYVDSKGKNFRLLFMVDEVGQYIGSSTDLMINLQSIVEELGTQCREKVWVMVTSQEAIDSVIKVPGNDFSKIQGRFNTKLSLSSSSVDEVIKKRILAKNEVATDVLKMVYDKERAVLNNLFAFNNPVLDIKGFTDSQSFVATYPFVPYQFIILQKVLAEIRKHGNSGKHLSGGERSMLSGFQEAAQRVQHLDEHTLVPFHLFYDTVHSFLESPIRRVIDRCSVAADNHDGIESFDVDVLKLLYLVRYIDDIKANIDNIAIMMIDDIRVEKIALREKVEESLERLLSQNYISRNGETYLFLTDEEQEVAAEIKHTVVDNADISRSIAETVFDQIYPEKKFKYGKYVFPYDRYVDDLLYGSASGGMRVRILTAQSDYSNELDPQLLMDSKNNNEAIIVLSDEAPYFSELEEGMKIRKYVKQQNISQLPDTIQEIVRKRQKESFDLERRAKTYLEQAIINAKVFVHGSKMEFNTNDAKKKLDSILEALVESVYSNLNMITVYADKDADILEILNNENLKTVDYFGVGEDNAEALAEVSQWLEVRNMKLKTTTMEDVQSQYSSIPYGWREIDIAALIARLIAQNKIVIKYGGSEVSKNDRKLVDYLRKKSEVNKAEVLKREVPSEELIRNSIQFLREYMGEIDIPSDEEGLVTYIVDRIGKKLDYAKNLLNTKYNTKKYPGKETTEKTCEALTNILKQQKNTIELLTQLQEKKSILLDLKNEMEDVEAFFRSQVLIYDKAFDLYQLLNRERDYFTGNKDLINQIDKMGEILNMGKPYHSILELPVLIDNTKKAYLSYVESQKNAIKSLIESYKEEIHLEIQNIDIEQAETLDNEINTYFDSKINIMKNHLTLTELDAMNMQLRRYKNKIAKRIAELQHDREFAGEEDSQEDKPITDIKIKNVHRIDFFAAKNLYSKEEIDLYTEEIREKLYKELEGNDVIHIN